MSEHNHACDRRDKLAAAAKGQLKKTVDPRRFAFEPFAIGDPANRYHGLLGPAAIATARRIFDGRCAGDEEGWACAYEESRQLADATLKTVPSRIRPVLRRNAMHVPAIDRHVAPPSQHQGLR